MQPNGDLLIFGMEADRWATLWHRGRDAEGTPVYRFEDREVLPKPRGDFLSPYTRKPDPTLGFYAAALDPSGSVLANVHLRSSPDGTGLMHNAGTDLAGFDREGRLRWFHRLDADRGLEGLSVAGPVAITGVGTTAEILAVNHDGLGLGSFGQPARVHYEGFFLDHPEAVRAYQGHDGRIYALVADNYNGRHHWYRLEWADRITTSMRPVTLNQKTAATLAALPSPPPYVPTRPEPPIVRIPRLAQALPINGDLNKWRRSGLTPQVVITPETASGGIDGPEDCSAVVRLAYHGKDLYVQFLVFDDAISFHQNVEKHYKQDGVEICLNGFLSGFKFDVTVTTDAGPIVHRNRFYFKNMDWAMPANHVPRVIKILDNARDVTERDLIEGVYGADLSASRVIVTELKLPIDEVTYQNSAKELKTITPWDSGREFWLGFLINENDEPGTDIQNYLVWPASYGNFNPVEDGARAILE